MTINIALITIAVVFIIWYLIDTDIRHKIEKLNLEIEYSKKLKAVYHDWFAEVDKKDKIIHNLYETIIISEWLVNLFGDEINSLRLVLNWMKATGMDYEEFLFNMGNEEMIDYLRSLVDYRNEKR